MKMAYQRKSNIELLRIVAMLMIMLYHMQSYVSKEDPTIFRLAFRALCIQGGGVGVGIFLMITSWFISEKYDECKAVRQAIQVAFVALEYMTLFFLMYIMRDILNGNFSISGLLQEEYCCVMEPLWLNHYWYVTAYVFFIILAPLVHKLLSSLNKSELLCLVAILTIIMLINPFGGTDTEGKYINNVFYALYIFTVIFYLKKIDFSIKPIKATFIILGCWVILNIGNLLHGIVPDKVNRLLHATIGYTGRYQLLQILMAICFFYLFLQINVKPSKRINFVAGLTFGVYLFHNNPHFDVLKMVYQYIRQDSSIFMFVMALIGVIVTFIVGCVFEFIRKTLLDGFNERVAERISNRIWIDVAQK